MSRIQVVAAGVLAATALAIPVLDVSADAKTPPSPFDIPDPSTVPGGPATPLPDDPADAPSPGEEPDPADDGEDSDPSPVPTVTAAPTEVPTVAATPSPEAAKLDEATPAATPGVTAAPTPEP